MISKPKISASLRPTIGALAAIVFLLPSGLAHAQSDETCDDLLLLDDAQLAATSKVALKLVDRVEDGCWPRPESAKNAVELELLNSGVTVTESGFLTPTLVVHGLGYGITGSTCVVTVSLELVKTLVSDVPYSAMAPGGDQLVNFSNYVVWSRRSLMSGPKSGMQGQIKDYFEEVTEEFLLSFRKAQTALFETCPRMQTVIEKAASNTE